MGSAGPEWGCTVRRTDPKLPAGEAGQTPALSLRSRSRGGDSKNIGRIRVSGEFSEFDAELVEGLGE